MIYLDYSATTPVSSEVLDTINSVTKNFIGNANSINSLGVKSKELLDSATKQIADLFGVSTNELTYTSSSTESNNMALIGYALQNRKKGNHIIVSNFEHPSIYAICSFLKEQGFEISYVNNKEDGLIDFEDLKKQIKKETILVSIACVNSETGIHQPLKMIRQIINKINNEIVFHSDMTQAIGKTNVNLHDVDLASISSHKIYGPKGIAILYKRDKINIKPLIYGSGKTNELKPGTPALPLIAGFSKALRLAIKDLDKKEKYIQLLNDKLCNYFNKYPDIKINKTSYSIPHILNISVMNIRPEVLIHALDEKEIYLSTNTACSSGDISNAVMALYKDENRAKQTVRISLSHLTTTEEINKFIDAFSQIYDRLNVLTKR